MVLGAVYFLACSLFSLPDVFFCLGIVFRQEVNLVFLVNVGGLNVHLDGCGFDIFSDLEKDFLFGADIQSGEELGRRVHPPWYMGDLEVKLEYKVTGIPHGGRDHLGLEKPRDRLFVR